MLSLRLSKPFKMRIKILIMALVLFTSCSKSKPNPESGFFICGADLSALPQIKSTHAVFYNLSGQKEDFLTILKNNGVNTIRLRLWNHPVTEHSSFSEVKTFSAKIHSLGLKVWIDLHYSDTWADPSHQEPPLAWQGISFDALNDSVYNFTKKVVKEIAPDFIQIGNEINPGLLLPDGAISNETQFLTLLSSGVKAVRNYSDSAKIIIHYAGIEDADWFFSKISQVDYDIIGISYYPVWHGHDLSKLETALANLGNTWQKEIVIAETAYPFTLKWNDQTHNIVGLESQLILPDYPATPQGQKDLLAKIKHIIEANKQGIGFCYWGGELIAFNGTQATDGSPWENQALFDFNNKALPVLKVFNQSYFSK